MDNLVIPHTELLESIIKEKRSDRTGIPNLTYQAIIDHESKNYLLIRTGWRESKNYYLVIYHFQIAEDGKVWVHQDNTDSIIVDDLLEAGIPKDQIVLAFHAPERRPDTDFAH